MIEWVWPGFPRVASESTPTIIFPGAQEIDTAATGPADAIDVKTDFEACSPDPCVELRGL